MVRDSIPALRNLCHPCEFDQTLVEWSYRPVNSVARDGQQTDVGTIAWVKPTPRSAISRRTVGSHPSVLRCWSSVTITTMSGRLGPTADADGATATTPETAIAPARTTRTRLRPRARAARCSCLTTPIRGCAKIERLIAHLKDPSFEPSAGTTLWAVDPVGRS